MKIYLQNAFKIGLNRFQLLSLVFGFLLPQAQASSWVQQIKTEIQQARAQGKQPVGVFDLDETLIHSDQRKVRSYLAAIQRHTQELMAQYPRETTTLLRVSLPAGMRALYRTSNQYNVRQWLGAFGIESAGFAKALDSFAFPIYLHSEFMHYDRAISGAAQLLKLIYDQGGVAYFVSARLKSKQYEATLQSLIRSQLYFGPSRSQVILREEHEDSLQFKDRAFRMVKASTRALGRVIVVAENEPENMALMIRQFPQALPIFVDGAQAKEGAVPRHPRLIRVRRFDDKLDQTARFE